MKSELQNGIILRKATADDTEKVAAFNDRVHAESGEEGRLAAWTIDLMHGRHPTTSFDDFLVVETEEGEIVSSTCNIPQIWHYDGVPIQVGRPELVGTDEKWRKKGLVREQFKALHAISEKKGDLMQVITGIPWYYRQFGYSHALDLGGGAAYDWGRPGNLAKIEEKDEKFEWRPAVVDDIPALQRFYADHCKHSLITAQRDEQIWRHELQGRSTASIYEKFYRLVTNKVGEPAGYVAFTIWPSGISIAEIGCAAGQAIRPLCLFVTRAIHRHFDQLIKQKYSTKNEPEMTKRLIFYLGQQHDAYTALGPQLGKKGKSYAWYIRIPDIPAFLMHIRPVLERRLASSVMMGHTGIHKVNLYREHFAIQFEKGKIISIEPYQAKTVQDGDTLFTRPEFIQLICGHKSFSEINHIHVDCYGNAEAAVLMNILFPQQHSQPIGIT